MSGGEVLGLVSGIIAVVDATLKVYNAYSSASGLPSAFRDVATRLPLVRASLCGVLDDLTDEPEANRAAASVLKACAEKAAALDKIFHAVIPRTTSSNLDRYRRALQTIPKADRVESLMAGILADLQVLAFHRGVGAATKTQIEALVANGRASQREEQPRPVMTFRNAALGAQIVHTGNGNQNINIGGPQINSDVRAASFYFSHDGKPGEQ
ncbi:hypothetical protein QQZ08_005458 [Neonectria magnoliae]|uniref:NACHT-NTPase and P-loop NTPases N-terminal domain-containing protein n=1 Tax=Neonectria magnoliae TaxID=2732573 RepID=A0ABR1I559_9HYPO